MYIEEEQLFTDEPVKHCPRCGERVYAEFVDNGFGPFSVQADPYHCEKCGWIERGCPQDKCVGSHCQSWDFCLGRSLNTKKGIDLF